MATTTNPTAPPTTSRPGMPLVGAVAIAVGLTIIVAAVLTAIVGEKAAPAPPTTQAATQRGADAPNVTPDVVSDPQQYQVVRTRDGTLSFEAPVEWPTLVDVEGSGGGYHVAGAGAVSTTLDDYKQARSDGIVAVASDPTEPTSAGLTGAIVGNSSIFCPATGCTTGKPSEKDVQLPSPVSAVDTQLTVSEPATDGGPGELRYTIETAAPTRYVVVIVRAADPAQGTDVLEHALASMTIG